VQRRGKLRLVSGSVFLAGVDATTTETSLRARTASNVRDEMVGIMHWGVSTVHTPACVLGIVSLVQRIISLRQDIGGRQVGM